MFAAASRKVRPRLFWVVLLMIMVGLSACGGDDEEAEGEEAAVEGASTTVADAEAGSPDGVEQTTAPPTTAPPTTTTTVPQRRMGVVLLAPDEANNSLNMRSGPGTNNPVVTELSPAQAELVPTGAIEVVDGRVWHQVITQDVSGWVYGYYLTETWSPSEVEQEWDWRAALEDFANALVLGEGLQDAVSWRGLFVIHFDDNLRRWTPDDLPVLHEDDSDLRWSNTGASASEGDATVGSWKEVVADPFLTDYLDEDVNIQVGELTLGANAVLPGSAISSAFVNFPWVAIHDPGDNPDFGGLDWSTWLVFLEMEEDGPKVVGLQPQVSYP